MSTRTETPGPAAHGGTPILADVRRRFGGIDTPAAIVGALTAIGVIAFLTALLAAGSASIAFQMDLIDADGAFSDIDLAGFAVALAVVFVGFVVGGWAAGRMARYDGGKNGLAAAFWMLVFIVGFAAAGALISEEYNAFATTDLPDWMSQVASDDATTAGIAAAAVAIVVMFLGGWLGGRLGETYHHRVDAAVAHAARNPEQTRPDHPTSDRTTTDQTEEASEATQVDDPSESTPIVTVGGDAGLSDDVVLSDDALPADVDGADRRPDGDDETVAARSRMRAPDAGPEVGGTPIEGTPPRDEHSPPI